MKSHREERSFSFCRIESKKDHSSYFSLYPITSNVDECLTQKRGKVEAACSDSKAVFHMTAVSGDLQPLSPLLESGKVGMAPASSASLQSMRCAMSQVSFLFI